MTMFPAIRQRLAALSTAEVTTLMSEWRRAHATPTEGIFVAEDAGRIIGTLFVDRSEAASVGWWRTFRLMRKHLSWWKAIEMTVILRQASLPIGREEIYISGVAIDSTYRRSGVAQQLVSAAEAYARHQRKRVSTVLIEPTNQASLNLFQKSGYQLYGSYVPLLGRLLLRRSRSLRLQKELV